jgi:hypothetical protein
MPLSHIDSLFSVGPTSMPCQLMMGFFAYAKSLEIHVDKKELEGVINHQNSNVDYLKCVPLDSFFPALTGWYIHLSNTVVNPTVVAFFWYNSCVDVCIDYNPFTAFLALCMDQFMHQI